MTRKTDYVEHMPDSGSSICIIEGKRIHDCSTITQHTLDRWKRKAKIIASVQRDLLNTDIEMLSIGLVDDILKVLK